MSKAAARWPPARARFLRRVANHHLLLLFLPVDLSAADHRRWPAARAFRLRCASRRVRIASRANVRHDNKLNSGLARARQSDGRAAGGDWPLDWRPTSAAASYQLAAANVAPPVSRKGGEMKMAPPIAASVTLFRQTSVSFRRCRIQMTSFLSRARSSGFFSFSS